MKRSCLAGLITSLTVFGCGDDTVEPTGDPIDDLVFSIAPLPDPPIRDDAELLSEEKEARDGTIFVCREYERSFADASATWPLFDSNSDVLWPGACLQGASLIRATPDPITAPRGPGKVVFTNINGSPVSSASFPTTSISSVTEAANEVLAGQPDAFPADFVVSITKVRSKEELQIALSASGSYFDIFSASSRFELLEDERYSHFLVALRQTFFDLVFERPALPHEFFEDGLDVGAIAPHVGPENPPTYVSRVTYGRVFYLLIESIESDTDIHSTLDANFSLGAFGGDVGAQIDYVTEFRDLRISAYAYGGDGQETYDAVFSGLAGLNTFRESLRAAAHLNQAKPLFFTLRAVATDELVKNGYSAGYTFRECAPIGDICTPTLLSPLPGGVVDNGCRCTADPVKWHFVWSGCTDSDRFELQVTHASFGVITRTTSARQADILMPDYVNATTGWRWAVRARTLGEWGPWSPQRSFKLEDVDADCRPTGVRLFEHFDFEGRYHDFDDEIPDLRDYSFDNITSSLRLYNISSVRLYEHPNYEGQFTEFYTEENNVQHRGFPDNKASSLKIFRCN